MLVVGTFNWSMECSWIAPLTPVVMMIRELIFHPLFCIVFISGLYIVAFVCEGLLWEFVMAICEFNKLDCVWARGGDGNIGVCV